MAGHEDGAKKEPKTRGDRGSAQKPCGKTDPGVFVKRASDVHARSPGPIYSGKDTGEKNPNPGLPSNC